MWASGVELRSSGLAASAQPTKPTCQLCKRDFAFHSPHLSLAVERGQAAREVPSRSRAYSPQVEGSPSLRWQMALYRGVPGREEDADDPEKIVRRVQEVSAVLYHLDQVGTFVGLVFARSLLLGQWAGLADGGRGWGRSLARQDARSGVDLGKGNTASRDRCDKALGLGLLEEELRCSFDRSVRRLEHSKGQLRSGLGGTWVTAMI